MPRRIVIAPIVVGMVAFALALAAPIAHAEPSAPTSFRVTVTGSGRPIIFIPGLTCDGSVWDATIAHLGGHVQAHVLSLAGFGGVPAIGKPPLLLPTVHDELVDYIRRNHLDHPILVGHSLGAFMTFWIAASMPGELGGIIAVDGAPFMPALFDPNATIASVRTAAKQMGDRMAAMSPADFKTGIADFFQNMFSNATERDHFDAIAAKSDPKTTGAAMVFLFTTDLRPELPKITAPALVIVADTRGAIDRKPLEASWNAELREAAPQGARRRRAVAPLRHARSAGGVLCCRR